MEPDHFADPDPAALAAEAGVTDPGPAVEEGGTGRAWSVLSGRHDELMRTEGVVMVGIGAGAVGEEAIVVGVKRPDQLAAMPTSLDGVPVRTEVIGEVDAYAGGGGRRKRPAPR